MCVSAATFGLGSLSIALEVTQGPGLICVEKLSLLIKRRGGRDFFHADV